MKAKEIQEGHIYVAKVSSKVTRVRVDKIREYRLGIQDKSVTRYDVTNLTTGRRTTFRTAGKFRFEVREDSTTLEVHAKLKKLFV